MKIGDRVYVHGYVDEIRKDCVIIHNDGGYFGTVKSEIVEAQKAEDIVSVIRCKDCKHRPIRDERGNVRPSNKESDLDPCPCINSDDWFYNWMPEDNFYCGSGRPKESEG